MCSFCGVWRFSCEHLPTQVESGRDSNEIEKHSEDEMVSDSFCRHSLVMQTDGCGNCRVAGLMIWEVKMLAVEEPAYDRDTIRANALVDNPAVSMPHECCSQPAAPVASGCDKTAHFRVRLVMLSNQFLDMPHCEVYSSLTQI